MSKDFNLDKYKADQVRARDLGFDYAELSSIINSAHNDGDDGISMGRAIEMIREIGLRAVDKAVAQERENVVAYVRERGEKIRFTLAERSIPLLQEIAYSIELNQHLKENT